MARGGGGQTPGKKVPFVDLVGAMSDPSLPLTVHEYDEWGDPAQPGVLAGLQALCPYHGALAGAEDGAEDATPGGKGRGARFPPLLASAALNDHRAPFWGPLKVRLLSACWSAGFVVELVLRCFFLKPV